MTDLGEAEEIFAMLKRTDAAGIAFDGKGVYAAVGEDKAYHIEAGGFISPMYLKAHIESIISEGQGFYYTYDIKSQLAEMEITYGGRLRDVLLIDLASLPGGVDMKHRRRHIRHT